MSISQANITSLYQAASFTEEIRTAYRQLKNIQTKIALYQAGTNTVFNAAVNAALPAAERTEIGAMKNGIDALLSDWEVAHNGIINPA